MFGAMWELTGTYDASGGVVGLFSATFILIGASLITLYPHSHTHIQMRLLHVAQIFGGLDMDFFFF